MLISNYLNIDIKRQQKEGITVISQKIYLSKVLECFNISNCKPVSTPIYQNYKFEDLKRKKSESPEIKKIGRKFIGSLMYAVSETKQDLGVSVCFLSTLCQYYAVQGIKTGIEIHKRNIIFLHQYTVALVQDYKGMQIQIREETHEIGNQHSVIYLNYLTVLYVLWCCKKQLSVSVSSTESEYIALSIAITEACWLTNNLLCDFNITHKVTMYEDCHKVIKLAYNNEINSKLKHVHIRYHFIINKIKE